ncbi:MAG: signal peptidase II [Oscillospiraceae bacterium]|nr:signal peptidase II [Oscillospiraceae bacterium]
MLSSALIIIALAALDRGSKVLLGALLADGSRRVLIEGVLGLRLLEGGNTGAAFGLFQNGTVFLIIVTLLMIMALLYALFFKRFSSPWLRCSALLITAGGIGNLYDRIAYGSVTDFIEFLFIEFPVFNLADCYVTVGAAVVIIWLLFAGKNAEIFLRTEVENSGTQSASEDGDDGKSV